MTRALPSGEGLQKSIECPILLYATDSLFTRRLAVWRLQCTCNLREWKESSERDITNQRKALERWIIQYNVQNCLGPILSQLWRTDEELELLGYPRHLIRLKALYENLETQLCIQRTSSIPLGERSSGTEHFLSFAKSFSNPGYTHLGVLLFARSWKIASTDQVCHLVCLSPLASTSCWRFYSLLLSNWDFFRIHLTSSLVVFYRAYYNTTIMLHSAALSYINGPKRGL